MVLLTEITSNCMGSFAINIEPGAHLLCCVTCINNAVWAWGAGSCRIEPVPSLDGWHRICLNRALLSVQFSFVYVSSFC